MLNSFLWGLLATSSLIIGGMIATRIDLSRRTLGIVLAFGAGTLISAVSYELVDESIKLGKGTGFPVSGFFSGALVFYFADRFIERMGKRKGGSSTSSGEAGLVIPMVLGIILDGIPESIVIGLGIFEGGTVSLAMLVAVFISNLPESIAGTTGMKSGGWSKSKIAILWIIIAVVCAVATVAGYSLFSGASSQWLSFIQSFAAGAILMMLANSMIPEAFENGGKLAGVFTVLGFAISVLMVFLENT